MFRLKIRPWIGACHAVFGAKTPPPRRTAVAPSAARRRSGSASDDAITALLCKREKALSLVKERGEVLAYVNNLRWNRRRTPSPFVSIR
jgi:hypothetical protein